MVWMVLYLATHAQVQARIRQEIGSATGNSRLATAADRASLPYTEAAVMECLRMSTFVPISEPHQTLEDTTLAGYHIPEGSNVLANLYAAHMDEAFWGDPHVFRPERFLDVDGRVFWPEAYMPFSEG